MIVLALETEDALQLPQFLANGRGGHLEPVRERFLRPRSLLQKRLYELNDCDGAAALSHAPMVAERGEGPSNLTDMPLAHALVTAPSATPAYWMLFLHGILGSGPNWRTFAKQVVAERPDWGAVLEDDGHTLCYRFDSHAEVTGISGLMRRLDELRIGYKDLSTHQSSLEDIFVSLVHGTSEDAA